MEVDSDDIDVALRRSPLLIETGLRELFMRNDVTTAEDYSGGDEGNSWEIGIQNSIALEVHLDVGGIVTLGVEDRRLIVDRILPEQIRCRAIEKRRDEVEGVRPALRDEHRVIDRPSTCESCSASVPRWSPVRTESCSGASPIPAIRSAAGGEAL